jgi:hypothetical protein
MRENALTFQRLETMGSGKHGYFGDFSLQIVQKPGWKKNCKLGSSKILQRFVVPTGTATNAKSEKIVSILKNGARTQLTKSLPEIICKNAKIEHGKMMTDTIASWVKRRGGGPLWEDAAGKFSHGSPHGSSGHYA